MLNPSLYPQLYTMHKSLTGQGTMRGLSPNIWSRLAGGMLSPDGQLNGYFNGDDFTSFGDTYAVAANLGRYAGEAGAYRSYEDTGGSITQLATAVGGVVAIATDGTDNDEMWLQPGHATSVFGKIDVSAPKMFLFEARVKISSVADSTNWYCAMTEEGTAAADTISDAGALGDKDTVGFWVLEADGDALKYGWKKAGQTAVTNAYSTALVADTFYKLGWAYDPSPHISPSKRLTFYVNNVEQTSYGTDTTLAAATFPTGEELNFLFGHKNGSAAAKTSSIDWWACYQAG
jgi:hypothetical protein